MSFPGNLLDRISHIFDDGGDDVLIYILVFLFIFLAGSDDRHPAENAEAEGGMPVILIIVFLILFLSLSSRKELID